MDDSPEGIAGMGAQFGHGIAPEDAQQGAVGIDQLFSAARMIKQKAARHLIHKAEHPKGGIEFLGAEQGDEFFLNLTVCKLAHFKAVPLEEVRKVDNVFNQIVVLVHSIFLPFLLAVGINRSTKVYHKI